MESRSWRDTQLWKRLEALAEQDKDAEAVCNVLKSPEFMDRIQRILRSSSTSPTDFTLHDDEHSFRVAEWMYKIIAPQAAGTSPEAATQVFDALSCYELALLLLAAYLHDIGMTPEQHRVRKHYDYLLTGTTTILSEEEQEALQYWLDDQSDEVSIPLQREGGVLTQETLSQALLLTTHYCRHRHVEWGANWIREHLGGKSLHTYTDWVDRLIDLCRSHNQGFEYLKDDRFMPRPVGQPPHVVHLRYLAVVLRMADILDFDPERTPEVIFQHRAISPGSAIYWHRDHHITVDITEQQISFFAELPDARLHRASEVMKNEIEAELQMIKRLDYEKPFQHAEYKAEALPHRCELEPYVDATIKPKPDTYEYINGAFRPNTQKLLHLLSGTELYGNEIVAVRELLQNALDAVRESIAYHRLTMPDPDNPRWAEMFGEMYRVNLQLTVDENRRVWLICSDNGAGMSRAIIENYLLVSGASHRRDMRALERQCAEKKFKLGRTGQFGIGVLSYFMMADLVQITTRRDQRAADGNEGHGWYFETEGISAFGELRRDISRSGKPGTEVRLRLKSDIIAALAGRLYERIQKLQDDPWLVYEGRWYDDDLHWLNTPRDYTWWTGEPRDYPALVDTLENYLNTILHCLPCRIQFQIVELEGRTPTVFSPGWNEQLTRWNWLDTRSWFFNRGWRPAVGKQLLTTAAQQRQSRLAQFLQESERSLEWHSIEGELDGGMGSFRVHIPIFKTAAGFSNVFFLIDNVDSAADQVSVLQFSGMHARLYSPGGKLAMSWKGMEVKPASSVRGPRGTINALVEVDWQDAAAGTLSVSREQIKLSEAAEEALDGMTRTVRKEFSRLADAHPDSLFTAISRMLAGEPVTRDNRARWLHATSLDSEQAYWGPVPFPAIDVGLSNDKHWDRYENDHLVWQNQVVTVLSVMNIVSFRIRLDDLDAEPEPLPVWCGGSTSSNIFEESSDIPALHPDRIVLLREEQNRDFKVHPLWLRMPDSPEQEYFNAFTAYFPPAWSNLAVILLGHWREVGEFSSSFGFKYIWNREHLLCSVSDEQIGPWLRDTFKEDLDPLLHRETLLQDRDRALAWLMLVLISEDTELVESLAEHDQEFLSALWQLVFGDTAQPENICYLDSEGLYVLTPTSFKIVSNPVEIECYLPDPGPEWTIYVRPGSAEEQEGG